MCLECERHIEAAAAGAENAARDPFESVCGAFTRFIRMSGVAQRSGRARTACRVGPDEVFCGFVFTIADECRRHDEFDFAAAGAVAAADCEFISCSINRPYAPRRKGAHYRCDAGVAEGAFSCALVVRLGSYLRSGAAEDRASDLAFDRFSGFVLSEFPCHRTCAAFEDGLGAICGCHFAGADLCGCDLRPDSQRDAFLLDDRRRGSSRQRQGCESDQRGTGHQKFLGHLRYFLPHPSFWLGFDQVLGAVSCR